MMVVLLFVLLQAFALAATTGSSSATGASGTTIRIGRSPSAASPTIQGGVNLVPDGQLERWLLEIEAGVYNERVHISALKGPLTLQGLGPADQVVLRHACPGGSGDGTPGCTPCPPFNGSSILTPGMRADVTTMLAEADDLAVTNMTIANDACGYDAHSASQSDALQALGDRQLFKECRILGGQDTVLTGGGMTRQYFYRSFVNGSCDSIYGGSAAVFDQCTITVTDHITAHKPPPVENVTRGPLTPTYLFVDSRLEKPSKAEFDYPTAAKGRTELGRPWGSYAHVVYKNVWMADHIASYGWGDWAHGCSAFGTACASNANCWCQNVTYAEFNSTGPGAAPTSRVKWSKQLTQAEAARYTPTAVLRGWIPQL